MVNQDGLWGLVVHSSARRVLEGLVIRPTDLAIPIIILYIYCTAPFLVLFTEVNVRVYFESPLLISMRASVLYPDGIIGVE